MDATRTSLNDEVASEIRAWLGRRRLTGRQLAAKMGASQTWTATRLRGEQEMTLSDLERIAAALEVDILDLLPVRQERGGTIKKRSPAPALPAPGYADPHLANRPPVYPLNGHPGVVDANRSSRRPVVVDDQPWDSAQ